MNILVVEDNQDSRVSLCKFLRDLGHRVLECASGQDALRLFSREFNMILSDVKMPDMSGTELLRRISSLPEGQDVDMVLFTGHNDLELAIEALRAGAYDYLLKPINIEELVAVTERVAEHQALRRENKLLAKKFGDRVKAATEEAEQELIRLKEAYAKTVRLGKVGVFSDIMENIFRQAARFHTDRSIPVLIQGETGTGKEVVARYIHFGNREITTPFVDINCAALAPSIFESELFGYEAGAFTGGLPRGQKGKLDIAAGGTIFFDEITELPIGLQAKLLRVIQEKEFYRVGGLKKIKADVRIICASNGDMEKRLEEGSFRRDLYYRLNVGRIFIPPLRERAEEIIPLASMFLTEFARKRGKHFNKISDSAADILLSYKWPGNVRELRNTMDWVALMHDGEKLLPSHLGILQHSRTSGPPSENNQYPVVEPENFSLPAGGLNLESYINKIVYRALEMHKGNKTKTARYLGISRSSLYCRLEKMGKA
ncbi:MAG: sigma-54 dependent transcriptional regulator [Peptococcaceae bacterium]|nr:sigma-54 dependent transcriptional regulator [Peptococcaceae bacterium]